MWISQRGSSELRHRWNKKESKGLQLGRLDRRCFEGWVTKMKRKFKIHQVQWISYIGYRSVNKQCRCEREITHWESHAARKSVSKKSRSASGRWLRSELLQCMYISICNWAIWKVCDEESSMKAWKTRLNKRRAGRCGSRL